MSYTDVLCNGIYYKIGPINYVSSHIITINSDIFCGEDINSILFFSRDPRHNVSSLIYASNISFDPTITASSFGTLNTHMFLNYTDDYCIMIGLDILTNGRTIIGFTIYFPEDNNLFLREIKMLNKERHTKECPICFDTKENVIYIDSHHYFCCDCLLKIKEDDSLCPICRTPWS